MYSCAFEAHNVRSPRKFSRWSSACRTRERVVVEQGAHVLRLETVRSLLRSRTLIFVSFSDAAFLYGKVYLEALPTEDMKASLFLDN